MAQSKIQWCSDVWNPVVGCTRVSAGCDHCYAVKQSFRLDKMHQKKYRSLTVLNPAGDRHFNGTVRCVEEDLTIPLRWKKPRTIFVNSMSDLFHRDVPFEFIDKVFAVMALCPQHTFQILTKRPERMVEYLSEPYRAGIVAGAPWTMKIPMSRFDLVGKFTVSDPISPELREGIKKVLDQIDPTGETRCRAEKTKWKMSWPLPNVWLGTSVENELAAHRIYAIRSVLAAVRFLSIEPLIGPLAPINLKGINWVIIGGESGHGARDCDLQWIRDILNQCKAAGVPVFVKQLGKNPIQRCGNCGRMTGHCTSGAVGACGPGHAQLIAEGLRVRHTKGGDISEWPEELRVREFPIPHAASAAESEK